MAQKKRFERQIVMQTTRLTKMRADLLAHDEGLETSDIHRRAYDLGMEILDPGGSTSRHAERVEEWEAMEADAIAEAQRRQTLARANRARKLEMERMAANVAAAEARAADATWCLPNGQAGTRAELEASEWGHMFTPDPMLDALLDKVADQPPLRLPAYEVDRDASA